MQKYICIFILPIKLCACMYHAFKYICITIPLRLFLPLSLCICSRGWPSRPSMVEEALGLARLYAPVQGNARARKQEWVGWGAGWR